jgi:diguanylate cyclase (GGDEF)-like protein/PAS domain S-box-containing protein
VPTVDAPLTLLPWPIGLFSAEGNLLTSNAAFAQLVRDVGAHEATAAADALFASHQPLLGALRKALAGEIAPPIELTSIGQRQTYRVQVKPVPQEFGGPAGALVYAEPVSAIPAQRGARELRRRVLDEALDRINAVIFATPDHDAILDGVVTAVVEGGVADSAIIYLRRDHKWHIRHLSGLPAELKGREMEQRELKASLRAMEENRVVVINDAAASDEVTDEWVERFGIRALIDTEVEVMKGELADFAVHYHSLKRPFDDQDVTFMERVAAAVTLALRNAHLVANLRQERQTAEARREQLAREQVLSEALGRIHDLIHSTQAFDEIMRGISVEAAEAVGAESAVIYVREARDWVARYTYGQLTGLQGQHFSNEALRDSIRAIREGQTVLINDARADPLVNRDLVEHHGVRAVLDVALFVAEQPVGDFGLYHHTPGKCFTESDKAFMDKVGASVGLALQNADRLAKLRETEAALRTSEARYRRQAEELEAIYQQAPIGLLVFDRELRFQRINNRMSEINGVPVEDHIGKTPREVVPQLTEVADTLARQVFTTGRPVLNYEIRGETPAEPGIERYWTENWLPLKDETGEVWGINVVVEEITERKRAEAALRESEARFRTLADNIPQLTWMADPSGSRFWFNRRWHEYTGTTLEEAQGSGWQKVHHPEHLPRVLEMLRHALKAGAPMEGTFPLRGSDGSYRWFLTRAMPIRDERGQVVRWFGTDTDITERMQAEERERHQARHDPLTDLPNRRLLLELLQAELLKAQRSERKVAVLFLDLDRFKVINDTLGHEAGDALLQAVAVRLSSRVRRSDIVARLGGDEFTVLLPGLLHADQAREVAEDIVGVFRQPFDLAGQRLYVTTSVGIGLFPEDDERADGLLRRADLAMYEAKEQGRNTYRFYNPSIDRRAHERAHIEAGLRQALNDGGLRVVYQPEFDLRSGRVVGLEALVRWQHPELGLLHPERFIPVAEESDLITALDDWVLSSACAQAKRWQELGLAPICISVNVSARRFDSPDVVDVVRHNLEKSGLAAAHLELELTEGTVMRRIDQSIKRMQELVALGVRITVDDFGIGYSSLGYLKRLPIAKLKIDRSFVRDIGTDPDDRAIVQAVTALAHTLGKQVIAEGVETDAQRQFLDATGCEQAQGNFFAAPLPPEQIADWLRP